MSVYIDKKLVAVNGYEFNVYLEELKNRFQDKRITWNDEPDVLLTTALQQTYELAKRKPDVVLADELPDTTNENTIYLIKKYDDRTLTVGRFILLTDELNALHYIGPTAGDVFTDVDQLPTTGISKLTIYRLKKYLYKYNNEEIPKPAGFKSLDPSVVEITPSGIIHHLDSDDQEIIYHPWDAVTDAIVFDLELRGYVAIDYDFADASFFRLGTADTYVYHADVVEEIIYPLYHNPSETTSGYILIGSDTEIDEKTIVKNNQSKLQAKAILDVVTLPTTDILPNTVYRIIETSPIRMVKLFTYDFNRSTWINHSRISISEDHYAALTSQQKNDGTVYIVEDSDEFYVGLTYETLADKPAINGVTLLGELTLDDLSIYSKTDVDNLLTNKASALFVDELPAQPIALAWYYSKKFEDGTIVPNDKRALYVTDTQLNYNYMGTIGDIDLSDYVAITRKVGSNTLENDITAQQLFNDTKDVIGTVTNKTINADNNNITDIEVDNFKANVVQTSMPGTPTNTQLLTAKAVNDSKQNKLENDTAYTNPTDSDALCNVSLTQNKVKSITFANLWKWVLTKISGICEKGLQISSGKLGHSNSITVPTAKRIIQGTYDAQGHLKAIETEFNWSNTYNTSADNQLFTRKGANNMYTELNNGKQNKTWNYIGILGASNGSTITVKDDWTELLFVMRISEGSNIFNVYSTVQKEAFTQGSPTNNTTFIGFNWSTSYNVAMRISLRNTGNSRNVRVDYTIQNGWNNNGVYVLKR